MQSSESTSDSDSSASKITTVSVDQIINESELDTESTATTTENDTLQTSSTTTTTTAPSTPTKPTTTNLNEEPDTPTTKPSAAAISRHIDNLISQNEAIVDNWEYTSIRSYKQSVAKSVDETTSTSGLKPKTISSTPEYTTLLQLTKANIPALQRNLSTTSSSSSSSSSAAPASQLQQQASQAISPISQATNNSNNITTTAPTKRKSTPCLIAPTNLSNPANQLSHFNLSSNLSNSANATAAATAAALSFMHRSGNLRSISEHRVPHPSLLFTNDQNHTDQFQISQQHQANNNWPISNGTDYPSESTGYSSAGSLSHQSSLCDTMTFSAPQNPLPTSISALLAQSLPSISAAISAASASIAKPSDSTLTTTTMNHEHANQNKPTSSSFGQIEPRSRKRSYEVRNRDLYYQNQALPSTSSFTNPFDSNVFASMASTSSAQQNNTNNASPLFNLGQLLDEHTKNQYMAMQQNQQQISQNLSNDQSDSKMVRIREKIAELNKQRESLQIELQEEHDRKVEQQQQQQQQHQHQQQQHQSHINNLSAMLSNDAQYMELLRQKFQGGQLPTTEHSAEMLTQSLDSATPGYKCQLCKMSFWTKDLLNYHHSTQCPSFINLFSLGLAQQQQMNRQQQQENSLQNHTNEVLNLHRQLQQLEMKGDFGGERGERGGNMSPSQHKQRSLSKSVSPTRAISQTLRPDLSILTASLMQRSQNHNFQSEDRLDHACPLQSLRRPSIKIEQVDDINGLNRSLSPLPSSSTSNSNNMLRRSVHESIILSSTLTPTTSSSSNLSLNSDLSGSGQLRPNSASMTSTINNSILVGGDGNNSSNNSLPLKKRKISAPGFI